MTINADTKTRPHWVYRVFHTDGRLLYIGASHTPRKRQSEHRNEKAWWWAVGRVDVEEPPYPDRASGLVAELEAIRRERPLCNAPRTQRAQTMRGNPEWHVLCDMALRIEASA